MEIVLHEKEDWKMNDTQKSIRDASNIGLYAFMGIGAVILIGLVITMPHKQNTNGVKQTPTSEASITTQPTKFVGKVTEVLNPDGVPLVKAVAMNEDFLGHKELAIATTNFMVGDVVRIVSVMAPGGKYFPVAMPVAVTNSWP